MMNAIQGGKTAGWGKSNNVVIGTILFVMILVWVPILISPDADTGIVTDTSVDTDNDGNLWSVAAVEPWKNK